MHFYPNKRAILEAALRHVAERLAERYRAAREATDVVESLANVLPLDATRQPEWRVWASYFGIAGVRATMDPDAWGASQQRALMASFVGLLRA